METEKKVPKTSISVVGVSVCLGANGSLFVPSSFEKIITDNKDNAVSAKSPFLNFIILYFFN